MSFFKKIQEAFGFGPDDGSDILNDSSPAPEPAVTSRKTPEHTPGPAAHAAPLEASPQMVTRIFAKVVEITNAALPGYLASAVNPEKQKKYLYDALDQDVKAYIQELERAAQEKCMALWKGERDKLRTEMDNLRQRAKELEEKRTEMNEQKLSGDRQRRALSQRVRDLDAKVMSLEAEKEQLEIEKHSLLNKAKVANVYEGDMEAMRKEIAGLKERLAAGAGDTDTARMKQQIEQLMGQVQALKEKNARLEKACEAARVKDEMGDAMLNGLQKKAAESLQSAMDSDQKIKELREQAAVKDARIADLENELREKDARIAEDDETFGQMELIAQQLDMFEQVKTRLEEKVAALKEELHGAQKENDTLRATIKNNLYAQARQEKAMRDEIDSLKKTDK